MEPTLIWSLAEDGNVICTENTYTAVGKRVFDILFSGLVCVCVLSWLIPVIGAMILVDSGGPVLFIQRRSGRRGQPFPCFKFRTMYHAPQAPFKQATQFDERVTPIGSFLRRTNLDEMPQFLNVLLGHMSMVGPRPHAIVHDVQYWSVQAYRKRYAVRPGITGLAQVQGARGETSHDRLMMQRVRYDHFYMRNQSFLHDVQICWKTLKSMVRRNVNAW